MAYDTPWSWIPPDWEQSLAAQPDVQPGQAMPEAGAFMPQPIPVAPPPPPIEPYIGFPANPDETPLPGPLDRPPVDAISGADPQTMPPEPAMQPGLGIPASMLTEAAQGQAVADREGYVPAPVMPPEPTAEGEIEFAPDELTEADRKQSLQDMDSPEFASFAAENELARQQDAAAKVATAARQRAVDAENDYKIFQESRASARQARQEVEQEAAKLASTQIDNDRWMNSRSVGQTIAAFVAAIVGGLVQGRTGGRNDGLAMIERYIERDIEEQKMNLANQRAAIGDKRAAANDQIQNVEADFRAEAAYRAASWERTIQMIEADQANYDPAGTSAIRLEGVRREAIGKQQAALMAFEEQQIKRMEAEGKSNLEIAKFLQKSQDDARQRAENERNNKAQNRAAQTSAGAAWKNATTNETEALAKIEALKAENAPVPKHELQRLYPNAPAEAFNIGPVSLKKFEKHLETFGKSADVGKDQSEAAIKATTARLDKAGPGGSAYTIADQAGNALLAKDGKTALEIQDPTKRTAITNVRDAAINIRKAADLYKIMRTKYGGASEALGSDEYQEYKSLVAGIDFETYKLFGLGAPSAGDQQMAADIRGGKDPTSFLHDSSGGFEAYAKNAESKLNTMIVGAGGAPLKLKSSEAAQSYERTITQNIDSWEPEALKNPDASPEAKKEAAQAALSSVDALADQAGPDLLRIVAGQNAQRVSEGLVDPADGARVQKTLRRAYAKKLAKTGAGSTANEVRKGALAAGLSDEEWLDRELGLGKVPE